MPPVWAGKEFDFVEIETFALERNQTLFENTIELNFTESGVHPCSLREVLTDAEIINLTRMPIGYGHTEGRPRLRELIASWYPGATLDNVAVTHGASEANLLAILTLLSPGDEVLFVQPAFMQFAGLARALGVKVKVHTLSADNGWMLDSTALARDIGPRTRLIALTNPQNPTGQVFTPQSMQALVDLAARHGAYLLSDEIYRGAEIERDETPSLYGMYDRVVVLSSLSKAFALPGLRLGWVVAPEAIIGEVARRQDYTSIGTGAINQWVAEKVMEPERRQRVLQRTKRILAENIQVFDAWLNQNREIVSCRRPQAGAFALVRYRLELSSDAVSERLRREHGIFVVAGQWFGVEQHVRLSIGLEPQVLAEGLERLQRFFSGANANAL